MRNSAISLALVIGLVCAVPFFGQDDSSSEQFARDRKLAVSGDKDAARRIAGDYEHGFGVSPDAAAALHWYEAVGDSDSLFEAARMYQLGRGVPADLSKAIPLYLRILRLPGDSVVRRAEMELGNLVIDGLYTSHDAQVDLQWARTIAQELIGQEQYKLAWTSGSSMDLPSTTEVRAEVVRTAAAYNVDLAQWQMGKALEAGQVVQASPIEAYAWFRLAGRWQSGFQKLADESAARMSKRELDQAQSMLANLDLTRMRTGAYYRADDALRDADFKALGERLKEFSDPDEQLRLAFHFESDDSDPASKARAMNLYRTVRDERVGGVRLKIGTEYLLGVDGFPKDGKIAARWYGFAAKAGSGEACRHLAALNREGAIPVDSIEPGICPGLGKNATGP